MSPEAAIASHAVAHLGAVQVPIFSGFAAPAVAARLADAEREGADHRGRVAAPRPGRADEGGRRRGARATRRRSCTPSSGAGSAATTCRWWRAATVWDELVAGRDGTLPPLEVDAETPYLLAYTSGTTGRPKGALHVQGGFLVSIAREVAYQADVRAGDRVLFATDMGWIMGPWTVVGGGARRRDGRLRRGRARLAAPTGSGGSSSRSG